jgi:hypothetical protein
LPTATPKAVDKEHFKKNIFFLCRLSSWRPVGKQFLKKILCRLPRNQQSAKPAVRADGAMWLCRLLAWQLAKDLPTQALPTALCRLPRGSAVGKAFAD